jgi:glutamine cyclotransferase
MIKKIFSVALVSIVIISCSCNNNSRSIDEQNQQQTTTAAALPNIGYSIVNVYPHSTSSFTEGLEWNGDAFYESGGEYGKSFLAKVDLKTGNATQKIDLAKDFFGEGITKLNGKIYQMTYKEKKCFVYDAKTFTKLKEFTYEGEGWGMTNDGKQIIMNNGSNNLYYRDPETFLVKKVVPVKGVPTENEGKEVFINELEYVNGFIYANTWTRSFDKIMKIDSTGKVVGVIDFTDVLERYASLEETQHVDVLNGIAYDSIGKRFFITGKYWPKLFEIKLN